MSANSIFSPFPVQPGDHWSPPLRLVARAGAGDCDPALGWRTHLAWAWYGLLWGGHTWGFERELWRWRWLYKKKRRHVWWGHAATFLVFSFTHQLLRELTRFLDRVAGFASENGRAFNAYFDIFVQHRNVRNPDNASLVNIVFIPSWVKSASVCNGSGLYHWLFSRCGE